MKTNRRVSTTLLIAALFSVAIAVPASAAAPRADVVGEADIQAQIEQRVDREAADRQVITDLLRRPDVRKIAGVAGIDIQRVTAAAGLLSSTDLAAVAASANEINTQAGGAEKVTVAVTTIIIILLLIIILAD